MKIEHIHDDIGMDTASILHLLKGALGGDDSPLWPANQRWLLMSGDRLLAHVSVQRRWFIIKHRYFEGWYIGGVCVEPSFQRKGIGTLLMQNVHEDLFLQELPFAVLGCSPDIAGFYKGLGYVRISDCSLHICNEELLKEDNTVMGISLSPGFDINLLSCERFPFGFIF